MRKWFLYSIIWLRIFVLDTSSCLSILEKHNFRYEFNERQSPFITPKVPLVHDESYHIHSRLYVPPPLTISDINYQLPDSFADFDVSLKNNIADANNSPLFPCLLGVMMLIKKIKNIQVLCALTTLTFFILK